MHAQRRTLIALLIFVTVVVVAACGRSAHILEEATATVEASTKAAESATEMPEEEAPEEGKPETGEPGPEPTGTFDRTELLTQISHNVIVPAHETFLAQAVALADAATAFDADPSVETLAALRNAWRNAADAWKACEIFSFRETMILHNQIDKWPTKPALIEGFITDNESIDEAFISGIGSTSRGLPALEYLIFDPEAGDDAILLALTTGERSEHRRQYVVALAQNIATNGQELLDVWTVDAGTGDGSLIDSFVEASSEGGDVQGSLNMLANEMMALLENVAHDRLGEPLGKSTFGEPVPSLAEAYRSGHSLNLVVSSLHAIENTFHGADGLGFDDYLDYVGAEYEGEPLSAVVNQQFQAAYVAQEAVTPPLRTAVVDEPDTVEAAYESIRSLIVLLKADMANHLGVTITFSDNDGD